MTTARRALAVGVALAFVAGCDGSGGDAGPEASAPAGSDTIESASPLPTGGPGPVVKCPRNTQEIDPALPDAVPEGATSVRLCDGGADKVTPPVDALTTDVESVATAVDDQPLARKGCVELRIPEYQLAFGYPDGSRFVVAGRFTACAELLVGSARRARAGPPLRTFVELLRAQRADATPPATTVEPADLDCGRPLSNLPSAVALPTDLAVAVLCSGEVRDPGRASRVEIPAEELTLLTRSMQSDHSSSEGYPGCPVPKREYWIVGATAWGDPVVMRRGCFGLTIEGFEEWAPRGEARAILRRLVMETR